MLIYVKIACIMFDADTGHYLDAFDCPMRFALHEITVQEILSVIIVAALLLLRTDKDFYFRSQTVPKLYMLFFIHWTLSLCTIGIFLLLFIHCLLKIHSERRQEGALYMKGSKLISNWLNWINN